MRLLKTVAIFFLVIGVPLCCQKSSNKELDIYPYITSTYIGPSVWNENENSGRFYRLVVTTVEIYKHLYVDRIITDEEGYDRNIETSYKIPTTLFRNSESVRDIELLEWTSSNVAKLKVDGSCYDIYLAESQSDIKIEECK